MIYEPLPQDPIQRTFLWGVVFLAFLACLIYMMWVFFDLVIKFRSALLYQRIAEAQIKEQENDP